MDLSPAGAKLHSCGLLPSLLSLEVITESRGQAGGEEGFDSVSWMAEPQQTSLGVLYGDLSLIPQLFIHFLIDSSFIC